jgi:hypothetical protein
VAGALGLLCLVSAVRMYFGYAALGRPIPAFDAGASALLEWGPWALLLPLVRRLARFVPFERRRRARALVVHAGAAVLTSLVALVLLALASSALREWRFGRGDLGAELAASFLFKLNTGFLVYWAALCAFLAWDNARRTEAEGLRRAEADRAALAARLAALQAQLAPHFLFNALNTIAASVHDDPDAAERMLARLGELLRTVVERGAAGEQTLADELAFLDGYLELQKERFGERLRVEREIESEVLRERVPSFLLLPLVENALVHGIGARPGPARLRLAARRLDGRIEVVVEDDGPGFRVDPKGLARRGFGLQSVRERLRLVHGEHGSFELGPAAAGGAAIRLAFPAGTRA